MTRLFSQFIEMSRMGTMVIFMVLFVRFLLRKAPKKYSYALWLAVWLRLVVAKTVSWNWSIFSLVRKLTRSVKTISVTVLQDPGEIHSDIPISDLNPAELSLNTANNTGIANAVSEKIVESTQPDVLPEIIVSGSIGAETVSARDLHFSEILPYIWVLGFGILIVCSAVSYLRLAKKLRYSVPEEKGIRLAENIYGPFTFGFIRPTIYLPFGLDPITRAVCIKHERCHIRRGDQLIKVAAFLITCVHWFNPFVWLAYYLMGKDQEMSCDEAVLEADEGIAKIYSKALLSFASNDRFLLPSPVGFAGVSAAGRIRHVLHYRKTSKWVSIVSLLLCILTVVSCGTDAAKLFSFEKNGNYTVRNLSEDPTGYGSDTGYLFVQEKEQQKVLTYIDYNTRTAKELCYLAQDPNVDVIPVIAGEKILLLCSDRQIQYGSRPAEEIQPSWIEILDMDGKPDGEPIVFSSDISFSLNNAKVAVSDESVVFVINRYLERDPGEVDKVSELFELNLKNRRYSIVYRNNNEDSSLQFLGVTDDGFIVDEITDGYHKVIEVEFSTLVEKVVLEYPEGVMKVVPYGNSFICLEYLMDGTTQMSCVKTDTLEKTVLVRDLFEVGLSVSRSDLTLDDLFIAGTFDHYVLINYFDGQFSTAYSTLTKLSQAVVDLETGEVIPLDLRTDVNGLHVPISLLDVTDGGELLVSVLEEGDTSRYIERKALISVKDYLSGELKLINIIAA